MTKTSRGKTVATIGIDIGKNSFHLIGMEAEVNVNGLGCQEDMKVEFVGHWASWCVMVGIDLETIRRMGGWKTLEMLQRYAAVSTDHMAEAMKKLA